MSNSLIRLEMRLALTSSASEILNDDGCDADNCTVALRNHWTFPKSGLVVARTCYELASYVIDQASEKVELLAENYLCSGSRGRVFPYSLVICFGRKPYPDIEVAAPWADLTVRDMVLISRYASEIVERWLSLHEMEPVWRDLYAARRGE